MKKTQKHTDGWFAVLVAAHHPPSLTQSNMMIHDFNITTVSQNVPARSQRPKQAVSSPEQCWDDDRHPLLSIKACLKVVLLHSKAGSHPFVLFASWLSFWKQKNKKKSLLGWLEILTDDRSDPGDSWRKYLEAGDAVCGKHASSWFWVRLFPLSKESNPRLLPGCLCVSSTDVEEEFLLKNQNSFSLFCCSYATHHDYGLWPFSCITIVLS